MQNIINNNLSHIIYINSNLLDIINISNNLSHFIDISNNIININNIWHRLTVTRESLCTCPNLAKFAHKVMIVWLRSASLGENSSESTEALPKTKGISNPCMAPTQGGNLALSWWWLNEYKNTCCDASAYVVAMRRIGHVLMTSPMT